MGSLSQLRVFEAWFGRRKKGKLNCSAKNMLYFSIALDPMLLRDTLQKRSIIISKEFCHCAQSPYKPDQTWWISFRLCIIGSLSNNQDLRVICPYTLHTDTDTTFLVFRPCRPPLLLITTKAGNRPVRPSPTRLPLYHNRPSGWSFASSNL